jgi:hypothetical protein
LLPNKPITKEVVMDAKNDQIRVDPLEIVVERAHKICNKMLLFEAVSLDEDEIRLLLDTHHITDENAQETYLHLVEEYDRQTGGLVI